ncbi:MAG: hypothetical protein E7324_07790 [Clostridiales bacterium]|nr:hypothetical protein [Clostridiales bacterium]
MSLLTPWRHEIRALIPRGFLRRDQGDGLFVSDFPRHCPEMEIENSLKQAGYAVEIRDGLAFIDGNLEKYRAMTAGISFGNVQPEDKNLYLFSLAWDVAKRDVPLERQPMDLLRLTLKCLDQGDEDALIRLLPPRLALLQRQGLPLPSDAGRMILFHLWKGDRNAD